MTCTLTSAYPEVCRAINPPSALKTPRNKNTCSWNFFFLYPVFIITIISIIISLLLKNLSLWFCIYSWFILQHLPKLQIDSMTDSWKMYWQKWYPICRNMGLHNVLYLDFYLILVSLLLLLYFHYFLQQQQ